MDTTRLGRGEMIASVSAIILLLVMFIFDWFGNDLGGLNAWGSFGFIDIVLFVTIVVAIGLAVMAANAQSHNLPVAGSALVCGLGILSVLLILYRIIDPPDFGLGDAVDDAQAQAEALGLETPGLDVAEIGRKIGVFLGLIAAGGIAYGGYEGMQEEGTSFSQQGDRLQNRGGGTPPPPPPENQPPPAERGGGAPPPPPPGNQPPPAV